MGTLFGMCPFCLITEGDGGVTNQPRALRIPRDEKRAGLILFAPAAIWWLLWFFYPTVRALSLSFYNYSFVKPDASEFIGFANYVRLFQDPAFYEALKHSFLMVAIIVPVQSVMALGIALMLNANIRGKTFFRTVCYMPSNISSLAVTVFFMYFFIKGGIGTRIFMLAGCDNVSWFANGKYALMFIIIVYIWQQLGYYMVIYLSGLQGISSEIYEASRVDGANTWQQITRITIPLIKNTTYLVLMFGMINAFQLFDQIKAVSRQSPLGSPSGATSTLVTFLYSNSFNYMEMGYGSAAAVVLFLIIFSLSLAREVIGRRKEELA